MDTAKTWVTFHTFLFYFLNLTIFAESLITLMPLIRLDQKQQSLSTVHTMQSICVGLLELPSTVYAYGIVLWSDVQGSRQENGIMKKGV